MNDFDAIKEQTDIVQFYQQVTGQDLNYAGTNVLRAEKCPICGHKDCCTFYPITKSYICYSCRSAGNMFNFIEDYFNIPDPFQKLLKASELTGIKLTNSQEMQKTSPTYTIKKEIFTNAAAYYNSTLIKSKTALHILSETRDYTIKTVEQFNLGYTGTSWTGLYDHLKNDYDDKQLTESGLVKVDNKTKKIRDSFVPKMFIIPHYLGKQVCDFTCKDSLKHKKPKGKVINQRLLVEKRLNKKIYFFNQDALYNDKVIITEGEHDAIQAMNRSGNRNILAFAGNPSTEKLEYLKTVLKNKSVYLAFDQDDKGKTYTKNLFLLLWGIAAKISVLTWDPKTGKDIDECLRSEKINIDDLINNNTGGVTWYLSSLTDYEDIEKLLNEFDEIKKIYPNLNDEQKKMTDLAIKDHFKKGKTVIEFLSSQNKSKATNITSSSSFLDSLMVKAIDGIYKVTRAHHDQPISNFVIKINERILYEDELHYSCDLIRDNGDKVKSVIFSAVERCDVRKFRVKCQSVGDFHFSGRDTELLGVWLFEQSRSKSKSIILVKRYGNVQEKGFFLFENCAIKDGKVYPQGEDGYININNSNIRSDSVFVYGGSRPKLKLDKEYTSKFAQETFKHIHLMLDGKENIDTYAGYLITGYIGAIIYSDDLFKRYGFFPFLFAYGPPSCGKTSALSLLLSFFGFTTHAEDWSSASIAGTQMFLSQLSSLPCWIDEFRNDRNFHTLMPTLKNIYNRVGAGKGSTNEKRVIREIKGCLLLSGEDHPADEGLLSRTILLRFTPLNETKNKAFEWLSNHQSELSVIVRNFILEKSEEKVNRLYKIVDTYFDLFKDNGIDPRISANYAFIASSIQLMDVEIPDDLDMYLVNHIKNIHLSFQRTENIVNRFISELILVKKNLLADVLLIDMHNDFFYLRVLPAFQQVSELVRKRGESLGFRRQMLYDYLKDLDGFLGSTKTYFNISNMVFLNSKFQTYLLM